MGLPSGFQDRAFFGKKSFQVEVSWGTRVNCDENKAGKPHRIPKPVSNPEIESGGLGIFPVPMPPTHLISPDSARRGELFPQVK